MEEVIVALLVTVVIPLVATFVRTQLVKQRPGQLRELYELTATAVQAAEKVGDVFGLEGADKYEYAEKSLVEFGKRVGLKVTPQLANTFIHSVLKEVDETQDLLSRAIVTEVEEAA